VLPFVNMSGDPSQDFYGPGIAEDIIMMLSSYPSLRVVSRTSSFVYDKPVQVQQVGKELKVNYVIEGSVRRAGNKVRVTAQLINASTGVHVWAERFDEESSDVAALQDDVAKRVYDTLAGLKGEVRRQEEADAWSKSAPSLGEYDYYLRGHPYFFQFTAEGNKKAGEIWREGLTKFPNSALLRAKMAFVHTLEVTSGRSADPWQETLAARKYATEADAIEDKSRLTALLTKWAMCWVYYLHDGNYSRASSTADGVVQTIPYDVFTKADLAFLKIVAGDLDQAIAWLEDSVRRDATPPAWYYGNLGLAYYFADRPQDALTMYDKADLSYLGLLRAAAEVRATRLDDARN
jgi:adenylate cyclase